MPGSSSFVSGFPLNLKRSSKSTKADARSVSKGRWQCFASRPQASLQDSRSTPACAAGAAHHGIAKNSVKPGRPPRRSKSKSQAKVNLP